MTHLRLEERTRRRFFRQHIYGNVFRIAENDHQLRCDPNTRGSGAKSGSIAAAGWTGSVQGSCQGGALIGAMARIYPRGTCAQRRWRSWLSLRKSGPADRKQVRRPSRSSLRHLAASGYLSTRHTPWPRRRPVPSIFRRPLFME